MAIEKGGTEGDGKASGLEQLYSKLLHQLEELTKLVRGDLTPLHR